MQLFRLLLFSAILSVSIYSQSKKEVISEIEKHLKESCKYECGLYEIFDPSIRDTILVDNYNLIDYYSYPNYRLECLDSLNKYLAVNGKI